MNLFNYFLILVNCFDGSDGSLVNSPDSIRCADETSVAHFCQHLKAHNIKSSISDLSCDTERIFISGTKMCFYCKCIKINSFIFKKITKYII